MYIKKSQGVLLSLVFIFCVLISCIPQISYAGETDETTEVITLNAPESFQGKREQNKIRLSWSSVEGAVGYQLYRWDSVTKEYRELVLVPGDCLSYTDSGLARKKSYGYRIVALSENGDSDSEPVDLSKKIPVPILHPTKLTGIQEGFYLTLSWKGHSQDVQYEVYRATSANGSYKLLKKCQNTSFTDKTVKPSKTYYYKVKARSSTKSTTYRSEASKVLKIKSSRLDPQKPMVALTFDDGPSKNTAEILKTLEKYDARATFFVLGNRVSSNKKTIKKIYDSGSEIGNHSWNHTNLGTASRSVIKQQLSKTDAAVKKITGEKPKLIRPPYGSVSTTLKKTVDRPLILWNIDTLDWKTRSEDQTYRAVIGKVKDGDIVLMHDLYSTTAAAAKRIIRQLDKQGYQMVTISEMAVCKKQKLKAGEKYFQIK